MSNAHNLPGPLLHLLGMSVLRHYDGFLKSLAACKKWRTVEDDTTDLRNDHPFIARVKQSFQGTGVSKESVSSWKVTVANSFKTRNFYAMRLMDINYDQRTGICIDSRPLIPFAMDMCQMIQGNSTQMGALSREMRTLSAGEQSRQETIVELKAIVQKLCQVVQKLSSGEGEVLAALLRNDDVSQSTIMPFHIITTKYTDNSVIAPATLFEKWFVDDLPTSIELTHSVLSGKHHVKQRKKCRQKFSTWKSAMNVLLRFAKIYPSPRPPHLGTPDWITWHNEVRDIASQAATDVKIGLKMEASFSISGLMAKKRICSHYHWAPGMPPDAIEWFENGGNNPSGSRGASQTRTPGGLS